MRRPAEIRAPPAVWIPVLRASYAYLRAKGVGDLLLYGSQAMSLYIRYSLRSKDIDLVTTQMRPPLLDELMQQLTPLAESTPRSAVLTRTVEDRLARTYSVYLKLGGYPLVLEIFDTILDGKDPSILGPHVQPMSKWGVDLYAPSPEAIVALRLSFRPPERITRLNAVRLNRFIQATANQFHFDAVSKLLDEWRTRELVQMNLRELYQRHRIRILHDEEIEPQIDSLLTRVHKR